MPSMAAIIPSLKCSEWTDYTCGEAALVLCNDAFPTLMNGYTDELCVLTLHPHHVMHLHAA